MVDIHLSEEEQVEALKKWWKENGRSVVAGVVLGLGSVLGWQYWVKHQQDIAEQAASRFQQLNRSVELGAATTAAAQAEGIVNEYPRSTYAVFAALHLARLKLEAGEADTARSHLQWVIDNSGDPSIRQIARVRVARLLLQADDIDGAAAVLAQADADSFQGDLLELKGDIAIRRGDNEAARQAYREALANQVSNSAVVQMKFDNLPAGSDQ